MARYTATDSCMTLYSTSNHAAMPGSEGKNTFIDIAEMPASRIKVEICGGEVRLKYVPRGVSDMRSALGRGGGAV